MKYAIEHTGNGGYIFNDRQVAVVMFANGSAMSQWIAESPRRRESIHAKQYVTSIETSRSVSVRKAAISPDDVNGNGHVGGFVEDGMYFVVGDTPRFGPK